MSYASASTNLQLGAPPAMTLRAIGVGHSCAFEKPWKPAGHIVATLAHLRRFAGTHEMPFLAIADLDTPLLAG